MTIEFNRWHSTGEKAVKVQEAKQPSNPLATIASWLQTSLPIIVVLALSIEATLAYRFWTFYSGAEPSVRLLEWVYSFSGWLVGPFDEFQSGGESVNASSVDVQTLVALDVYLIASVALIGLVLVLRSLVWAARHPERRRARLASKTVPTMNSVPEKQPAQP